MPEELKETVTSVYLRLQRWRLLHEISSLLDRPMTVLAFLWLGLLILDFTYGLTGWLITLNYGIWAMFVFHFALEFIIAPSKWKYLRRNWLTALALALPAFRVLKAFRGLRLLRAARATRSLGLVRLFTSLNRSMRAVRRTLAEHGVGYVVAGTVIVTIASSAGMYRFESPAALREAGYEELAAQGSGLTSYADALWWTAMMMTTIGSEYWPKTAEGRFLAWLLAIYAFVVFGYITATIASYFIGPAGSSATADAKRNEELLALRREIAALRQQLVGSYAGAAPPAAGEKPNAPAREAR